ncbi:NXPE family member 3 [Holothuria leucospilota]|uniref:NXPE family member 3 n=1 Tax=Holothuria leucospilota TaxID=206669 RepID=A0A9Q1BUZ7_HOLLE|nr:NXPE family member 3 [Holothuria leucospilota]
MPSSSSLFSSKVSLTGNRLPSFQVLDGGSSAKVSFPYCSAVHPPKSIQTSGYILQNKWQPFNCSVKKFNADNIESCLRGKTMHLYGDSTARQMFYYLRDNITCNSKEPFLCVGNETTVHFKFHGLPVRGKSVVDAKKIRYIAEEIDDLKGGPGVVIILSVWAHFGLPKGTFYRDRLIAIKQAVERLWIRSPETRVVIRSANTREHSIKGFILISSDWIALQGEKTLRSVFGGDDRFLFLDVWDLTLVQQPKDQIHPSEPTLTQMMDYLLTLLCDP